MARDYTFKFDKEGVREIWKSGGMQAALREVVEPIAEQASQVVDLQYGENPKFPHYKAFVNVLRNTAIGAVSTISYQSRIDENKYHTLEYFNH